MTSPQLRVFDFDGCLYPMPDNLMKIFHVQSAALGSAISNGTIPEGEAIERILGCFFERGIGYLDLCEEFDFHRGEAHILHHRLLNMDLSPDPELIAALSNTDPKFTYNVILTQASHCFLDRKLKMLGLENFFPRSARIAFEDYGFKNGHINTKDRNALGFIAARTHAEHITGLSFAPEDCTMFEDSQRNLIIPHQMGWNTVLVNYGKPLKRESGKDYNHIHREDFSPAAALREMSERNSIPSIEDTQPS